ncbi:MAG: hypothetical protein ACT4PZ_04280 [Panacagrimonas sp.]
MLNRSKRYVVMPLLAALSTAALAGAGLVPPRSECIDAVNCDAGVVFGTYVVPAPTGTQPAQPPGPSLPWTAQFYVDGRNEGECLRLDVLDHVEPVSGLPGDPEMVLTCPGGVSLINDDRSGGDLRPLIVTPIFSSGYCTVTISHFSGRGATTDFILSYARYDVDNPTNCSDRTPPLTRAGVAPTLDPAPRAQSGTK